MRACKSWLVLISPLFGWESDAIFVNKSQSEVKKTWITFDTQPKNRSNETTKVVLWSNFYPLIF